MTNVSVHDTQREDGGIAGEELGRSIIDDLGGASPDAVILFASPAFDPASLLSALDATCSPRCLIGCSSAGEFTYKGTASSSAVALAITSDVLRFSVHRVENIQVDLPGAVRRFASSFEEDGLSEYPHRSLMLLMDVLAGYGEEFLVQLTELTKGSHEIFGGGAADDAAFEETFVFAGTSVYSDAAVGLEIGSKKPVAIGVSHGWTPMSSVLEVTASSGLSILELDGRPAVDVIQEYALELGLTFNREDPLPFFLNHVLGIETDDGYKLRVPLSVGENGALGCAAEIPQGARVRLMQTRDTSAAEAARTATRRAWLKLRKEHAEPGAAVFFDCAATRLRLGEEFGQSVNEVVETLGTDRLAGCNTYGQFASVKGQRAGFHNCTAVVCAFPR